MTQNDITFVLPGLARTGGVRAVFEIADHLMDFGYRTSITIPKRSILSPKRSVAGVAERVLPHRFLPLVQRFSPPKPASQDWFPLRTPITKLGPILWRDLPSSKVVVATSYRTAEELLRWPEVDRRCVYFIQSYETWSGSKRRVDATWREFGRVIVSSEWLRRLATERFGKREVGLAIYGVDLETFRPGEAQASRTQQVVGFMWDDRSFKGGKDLVRCVDILRRRGPVQVRAFGNGTKPLAPEVEFLGPLSGSDLADFYRSLDVFVSASRLESGPMTIPEAMASGAAVVSTDVGNVRLWSDGGRNCRLVVPGDAEGLADAVSELLASPVERRKIADAARVHIAQFTWGRTARQFEQGLRSFGVLDPEERSV